MNKKKGFTLIELLVVVAIIGLLATMVAVSLTSARSRARDSRRVSDIRNIENALELYYSAYLNYPQNLDVLLQTATGTGYLQRKTMPTDPQGNTYCYAYGIDLTSTLNRVNFYHIGALLENRNSDFLQEDVDYVSSDTPGVVDWVASTNPGVGSCPAVTGGGFDGVSDDYGNPDRTKWIYDRGIFPQVQ